MGDDEESKTRKRSQPNPPGIDYRSKPQLYKVARGEQGVLTVEPYKAEILPHWRFRLVLCVCHFHTSHVTMCFCGRLLYDVFADQNNCALAPDLAA